jgi:hypothetical protein
MATLRTTYLTLTSTTILRAINAIVPTHHATISATALIAASNTVPASSQALPAGTVSAVIVTFTPLITITPSATS